MSLRRIAALLLLVPLLDMVVLVVVAREIGTVPTVALVVLTALIGMLLVRAEGRHTLGRIQRKVLGGEPPTDELLDGGLLIAAGAFLLTPGLVTDTIGFLLALPPTRYPIREAIKRWVVVPIADAKSGGFVTGEVYTTGFPGGEGSPEGTPEGGSAYDLGPDDYEVEEENGNS
ncbi:MAG: FxsA family protein [Halobacteriales archaeon]